MLVDRQSFPRVKLCAGLFTQKSQQCLLELLGQDQYEECMAACLMSRESEFRLIKGQITLVTCHLNRPITLIDRPKFDAWLVNHYVSLGGQFYDGYELIGLDVEKNKVVFRNRDEVEYEYLIAADGANSMVERIVAKQYPKNFQRKAQSALSLEINVDRADVDVTGVNIYFDVVPNSYAWAFAKGEKVCLGLVKQPGDNTNVNEAMRQFLDGIKLRNQQNYPLQGAMIPVGNYMSRPVFCNIMFVGDAAGFVEPLTDEGIFYALQSGYLAAKSFEVGSTPTYHYLNHIPYLKRMIDMGRFYQRLLEKPWSVKQLYKYAGKHPGFVAFFYETRIEQGRLDPFWKILLNYKLKKKC